jgi:hypothetical protein
MKAMSCPLTTSARYASTAEMISNLLNSNPAEVKECAAMSALFFICLFSE